MILLIEIALTVWVWKRGWKALALIPLGACLFLGFVIGLFLSTAAYVDPGAIYSLVVFDLLAIVALIIMGVRGYNPAVVTRKSAVQYIPVTREGTGTR